MDNAPLTDRVAVVTGGARGIGAAIARAFAADGAMAVITGLDADSKDGDALVRELGEERCRFYRADVGQYDECVALAGTVVRDFGRIDILVNNAGITKDRTIRKMPVEDWLAVVHTNLTGPFFMIKAVLDHMVARGYGRIINIASIVAQTGNIGQANYAAAKSGLFGLTKSLALEAAHYGITANCVAPGFTATTMVAAMPAAAIEAAVERTPARRLAQPEEIARVVRFLADEHAGFITGTVVSVNGGLNMQ